MPKFIVTPWEVRGDVDYNKLIAEFGTEKIDDKLLERIDKLAGGLHTFLRRRHFFSHRDLNWLLDEYEKGNRFTLYTGRGPSGNTHLGHLIPWMFTKWLQDTFDAELYFQLTDDEKFLFNPNLTLEETNRLAYENALDIIAVGFDPKKTKIFVNTDYAKTLYREAIKVAKKLTFSTTKAVFGFKNESNVGQIFFTSMQAVPAFLPSIINGKPTPVLIPYAIDQDPHFRVARDIIPKLGYPKPAAIHCRFLPGLGEGGKMSASDPSSAIYTTDDAKTVKKKILKNAFSGGQPTMEEHRRLGGNPDIDIPYQYLTFFEEDDDKLKAIHDDYKSGKMLTGEIKMLLVEKLTTFLEEHQRKREEAKKRLDEFIVRD
ncbi:MAG: tryptophan--tRNA ligase [archaeon]